MGRGFSIVGTPRLHRHPDGPEEGATRIEASLVLGVNGFAAQFLVFGDDNLLLPKRRRARRRDGLWEHTCFGVFLKPEGREHYFELNFAPSTLWAAYEHDGYRQGRHLLHMGAPSMIARRKGDNFLLRAQFDWHGWEKVAAWRVGLCAVIETTGGERSCWALAHPRGLPDFDHPDCFAFELAAPDTG